MEPNPESPAREDDLTIRTPEGVAFSLPLAGPVSRFLAWLLDLACLSVLFKLISVVVNLLGLVSRDVSQAFGIVLFFALNIGYSICLEWFWNGQTAGKRVLGLRVMDINGLRIRPSQIVLRNLLRAVDSLPLFYLVGGSVCLATRHLQRLGDLAANTIVVKIAQAVEPRVDRVLAPHHYNSLRHYPHLVARLRQQISPTEARAALQALLRRDELIPAARVELFCLMADHFKTAVKFPQDALEGISDEQYVRDVTDVLFRR
ncbi:MAG: RDD family protein [Desulfobacteraceae bacterium]|nr:MAG: RDD family protein [Desulfobacteraceae bacterium]